MCSVTGCISAGFVTFRAAARLLRELFCCFVAADAAAAAAVLAATTVSGSASARVNIGLACSSATAPLVQVPKSTLFLARSITSCNSATTITGYASAEVIFGLVCNLSFSINTFCCCRSDERCFAFGLLVPCGLFLALPIKRGTNSVPRALMKFAPLGRDRRHRD